MSSAYHPETDAQSEVLNRTLEMYLRCYCFDNPKTWFRMLPWAQYWYNTSYHSSIEMTPYKALFGQEPPSLIRYEVSSRDEQSIQDLLLERDKLLDKLKANMTKSQQYMKQHADKHRRHEEFQEGDLVLVKLQPYRQHSVALRKHQKIGLRFFGPFKVNTKLSPVAYRLELPAEARIHNVFHISLLKKFRGDHQQHYLPLPLKTSEMGPFLTPTAILAKRRLQEGSKETEQLQIQWEEGPQSFLTWENSEEFPSTYLNFNLEDKVASNGEGNVRKTNMADMANGILDENEHMGTQPELVIDMGQVSFDPTIVGARKSSRKKRPNRRLRDYVSW